MRFERQEILQCDGFMAGDSQRSHLVGEVSVRGLDGKTMDFCLVKAGSEPPGQR